jgi:hypothetical protein
MVIFDHKYKLFAFSVPYFPYIVISPTTQRTVQMQEIHPEMLNRHSSRGSVAAGFSAINDINLEFLRVLTNPSVQGVSHLLGLDAPVLEGLCAMSPQQLQAVAAAPQLLVGFHPLPDTVSQVAEVAEQHPPFTPSDSVWQHEMHSFVDRLMTCLWQSSRYDKLLAAFCIGPDEDKRRSIANLNFCKIRYYSGAAYKNLRAHLADHPSFWPDLVRAAHVGSEAQQRASRLSIIQLSVAKQIPRSRPTTRLSVTRHSRTRK